MRSTVKRTTIWTAAILAMAALAFAGTAQAQTDTNGPGVARVSLIHGDVSMQRGDSGDTSTVELNTPLVAGDKVFTGTSSRAEVQLDWADLIRLDQNAQADISTLDSSHIEVQLAQGLANFSVLKGSEASVEIDTPNVAVTPHGEGRYRIEVNASGDTLVTVRDGQADVSTPDGSTTVKEGQLITVRGTGNDVQFQVSKATSNDDFDKWNNDRDHVITSAESYRRTNPYYTGASDMDAYGSWSEIPDYGSVWVPRVAVGWAPYRHGRWVWESYWGWTWVADEPWGWAPYHYGRWFVHNSAWVWWPGPVTRAYRPIYAPAYVSFFGFGSGVSVGVGFGGGFGSIGWLPVGPCDYVNPWWGSHRSNFNVVNITNINVTNVRNVNVIAPLRGGTRDSNVHNMLVNNQVRYGLSTVSSNDFGRGRGNVRTVTTTELHDGRFIAGNVPVVPSHESLRTSDRPVNSATVARAQTQDHFFSRRAPSATPRESFSEQSAQVRQAIDHDGRGNANEGRGNANEGPGNRGADNANAGNRGNSNQANDNRGADNRGGNNQPAANTGGFGARNGNAGGNAGNVNTRPTPQTPQAQTPPSQGNAQGNTQGNAQGNGRGNQDRTEPTGGWRRFGNGQAGQGQAGQGQAGQNQGGGNANAPNQQNQRAPVVRAPRQAPSTTESGQGRTPDNQARPTQNATPAPNRGQSQTGTPRVESQRVAPSSNPERPAAQTEGNATRENGNQQRPANQGNNDGQPGWQRFSGGSPRGSGGGNQLNNQPSPRSDSRPALDLNRPIIQQRNSGSAERTAPANNARVEQAPRSAPQASAPSPAVERPPVERPAPQSAARPEGGRPQGGSNGGGFGGARSSGGGSGSRGHAQGHR